MTYSIVARDPETGEMGVAVQSHWFSVGPIVPWTEPGIGAVATQAFAEVSYGPLGLDLMRGGKPADQALRALLTVDAAADRRQVAMVDNTGRLGVHTGERCLAHAGHRSGDGYSAQANMMLRDTVPDAMAAAFESATGTLADRLLTALDAAEAEGGDIRGRQSAALVVVKGQGTGPPHAGRVVELRVEDHADPLVELRRLYDLHRAYKRMNEGDRLLAADDIEAGMREYEAAASLAPHNDEIAFWRAVALARKDRMDEARSVLDLLRRTDDRWDELLQRLVSGGLVPAETAENLLGPPGRGSSSERNDRST